MDERQPQTDSERGESLRRAAVRRSHDDHEKHESQDHLSQETSAECIVTWRVRTVAV